MTQRGSLDGNDDLVKWQRIPFLILAVFSLFAGSLSGLIGMGWNVPFAPYAAFHAPLMVGGFLGTLISLERAVASGRKISYLVPLLTGVASFAWIITSSERIGTLFLLSGSIGLVFLFISFLKSHPSLPLALMLIGAVLWVTGNLSFMLGIPLFLCVYWWMGFIIFTIAAERLELSSPGAVPGTQGVVILGPLSILFAGSVIIYFYGESGSRVFAAGVILVALWLYKNDIARRTVRQRGLTRFIAVNLLSGYFWLLVSGVAALLTGLSKAGFAHDIVVHSFFLGFSFSMIFAHAPVIFPSILHVGLRYTPLYYLHAVVLNTSLAARVLADITGDEVIRGGAGLFNVTAIVLFFIATITSIQG